MPDIHESQESRARHAGSRHHGHRHSLKGRIKRRLSRHKWLMPCIAVTLIVLVVAAVWMVKTVENQAGMRVSAGSAFNIGSGYRDITYRGRSYRYNTRITTILFAGVDSDGELVKSAKYTSAPRADSISLIVLDEVKHNITVIALNRDTMTKIRKFTLGGKDRGMMKDHLGYAYTYGDGGEVSCRNICEAVSELMYGIPVNEYIITGRGSLSTLGNLVGDVEVTVPNDDLEELGYIKGSRRIINGDNIETFVRTRDTGLDLSNVGRMERQRTYIDGAIGQIQSLVADDPSGAWRKMKDVEGYMQTNITRSRYLDLVKVLRNTSYDQGSYYTPEGRQVVASDHDEFYPDEEALLKKVVEIFYIEK